MKRNEKPELTVSFLIQEYRFKDEKLAVENTSEAN
jgi:hypothetical protein